MNESFYFFLQVYLSWVPRMWAYLPNCSYYTRGKEFSSHHPSASVWWMLLFSAGERLSWAALCHSNWLLPFCAVTQAVWIGLPAGCQWTWHGSLWTLGMLTVSSAWLCSVELLQFKNMGIWLQTDLRDSMMFLSLLSLSFNTHILSLNLNMSCEVWECI